jgi:hypothetical protein
MTLNVGTKFNEYTTLKVCQIHLRKKRLDGTGPPYIRLGDSKFARAAYRRSDLEGWLREKTFRSTSQETIGTHRVAGIDPDP